MAEIKFKRDTAFRKQFFVPDSFAHPAKMDSQLLMWCVLKYTEAGEVILDPMAGSGTTMLGCNVGRNVVLVELEEKFCKMMRDNWELVKMKPQLGCQMGTCQIIQGDARNLEGLLADKIITSPPYVTGARGNSRSPFWERLAEDSSSARFGREQHPSLGEGYSADSNNIGNLPYGDIDKIITSPPYAEAEARDETPYQEGRVASMMSRSYLKSKTANPQNIGNKPYGDIDSIITSPPYEGSVSASTGGERDQSSARQRERRLRGKGYDPAKYQGGVGRNLEVDFQYSKAEANIGNLTSDTYLEAMLQVYRSCFAVLRDGGLMILVTKNFIRNKKVVRLDTDTIKLCEQAGFSYVERHWRKLPAQSFWRIIYHKKHPEVEQIKYEDVLVFRKKETNA